MEIEISNIVKKYFPDVEAIYLFGSFASNQQTDESDVDLALVLPNPIDKLTLFNITQEIAASISRDIDLIDLRDTPLDFKFEIISTGTLIFCKNSEQTLRYEALVMSMYQRFSEERKGILEEIERSGTIFS